MTAILLGMRSRSDGLSAFMNIDYAALAEELDAGLLREKLRRELITGFRLMQDSGEPLPPASHFATRITEIVYESRDRAIGKETQFDLYQEILLACEEARATVLGDVEIPN